MTSLRGTGLDAVCQRLVQPCVACPRARARQARLLGILLVSPFMLAAMAIAALTQGANLATMLAVICASLELSWLAALAVSAAGAERPAGIAALFGAALLGGIAAGAAGGLHSPLTVMAASLTVEAIWAGRSGRAAAAGLAAAILMLATQFLLSADVAPSPWQWLVPLLYVSFLGLRLATPDQPAAENEIPDAARLEERIDAVVARLAANGEVTDATPQARDLMGLPPEILLGSGLFDRIHVADRVGYLCALAEARLGKMQKAEARIRVAAEPAGGPASYRPFALELCGEPGGTIVAVIRDNSDLVSLRQKLDAALEAAGKMEAAKSRFLAAISHELRTPLNAIIGFSDVLCHEMYGPFADPRQKEYVGLIRDSGNHLLSVVNAILDVTKLESGSYAIHPEPFRLADAVGMCEAMLQLQAQGKSIALKTEISRDIGEIVADRRAVQQILINLVSNAIKFTREGGRVCIGGKRVGTRLHLWVSDNGIGIPEHELGRLGRPFVQVQNDYTRQFEGTGLGLSLVKGLVALHDGTMAIKSAPEEGTTVTVSLPIAGPAEKREEERKPTRIEIRMHEEVDGPIRKRA